MRNPPGSHPSKLKAHGQGAEMSQLIEPLEEKRWRALINWLQTKGFDPGQLSVEPRARQGAGRGLFVTRTLRPPSEPLLRIPEAALLNSRSLKAIYPSIDLEGFCKSPSPDSLVLNGTQLLSIHLSLHRPFGQANSKDPHFGPYISTLPRAFSSHPISWIVRKKQGSAEPHELRLLTSLPPSVLTELEAVRARFWADWRLALRCMDVYRGAFVLERDKPLNLDDFLWGWLIVNTRCLYYKIFSRELSQSNLTLCPIIDFANHTRSTSLPHASPQTPPDDMWANRGDRLAKAHDFVFLSPGQTVDEGEEIYLRYGGHCNRTLFAEYGFVDKAADFVGGEVDVSDLVVDGLLVQKSTRKQTKELLDAKGYLSDLSLYATPPPAHPSWRLLCALRLANLEFPSRFESAEVEKVLQPWKDVKLGIADLISEANESAVRKDLKQICEIISIRSAENLRRLEKSGITVACAWYGWAKGCVVELWEEEDHVASATIDALESGFVF